MDEPAVLPEGAKVSIELAEAAARGAARRPAVQDFAGMLADLSDEEWERYQQAVQRRPLFGV